MTTHNPLIKNGVSKEQRDGASSAPVSDLRDVAVQAVANQQIKFELQRIEREIERAILENAPLSVRYELDRERAALIAFQWMSVAGVEAAGELTLEAQARASYVAFESQVREKGLRDMVDDDYIAMIRRIGRLGVAAMMDIHTAGVGAIHNRVAEYEPPPTRMGRVDVVYDRLRRKGR